MTQIKTPEEVAQEHADAIPWSPNDEAWITEAGFRRILIDAIATDRMRRDGATPLEIARERWQREREIDNSDADTMEAAEAYIAALEADRKQRDLYELLAEALDDRAEGLHDEEYPEATERRKAAAEALRNNEGDEAWCDFIGPMLDAMEGEYGR